MDTDKLIPKTKCDRDGCCWHSRGGAMGSIGTLIFLYCCFCGEQKTEEIKIEVCSKGKHGSHLRPPC